MTTTPGTTLEGTATSGALHTPRTQAAWHRDENTGRSQVREGQVVPGNREDCTAMVPVRGRRLILQKRQVEEFGKQRRHSFCDAPVALPVHARMIIKAHPVRDRGQQDGWLTSCESCRPLLFCTVLCCWAASSTRSIACEVASATVQALP